MTFASMGFYIVWVMCFISWLIPDPRQLLVVIATQASVAIISLVALLVRRTA